MSAKSGREWKKSRRAGGRCALLGIPQGVNPAKASDRLDKVREEEPDATYRVELFEGVVGGDPVTVKSDPLDFIELDPGFEGHFYIDGAVGGSFYFIKVTQSLTADDHNNTEDNAWSSPIWLTGDVH